ncbi:MAG: cytochrome c3 family protein [Nitrospira sp.]
MKKGFIAIMFSFTLLSAMSIGSSATPLDEVYQTRHNLVAPFLSSSNVCTVCHTESIPSLGGEQHGKGLAEGTKPVPGESGKRVSSPPLWNTRGAKPYDIAANLPLNKRTYNHPAGSSLVCLACHDGALGKDMHGINVGNPRVAAFGNIPWTGSVGAREAPPLSRVDHPISILYPRKPTGIFVPVNPTVTRSRYWALPNRHVGGFTLPTSGTSSYLDLPVENVSSAEHLSTLVRTSSGRVECDSCHDPHSEKVRPFLRVPSATLCLICHDR